MSKKINNSHISPRAYWSILKEFLNNKKTPIILTLPYENRLHRKNHLIFTNQSGFKTGDP